MFGFDVRMLVCALMAYAIFAMVGLFWFYSDVEERYGLTAGCLSLMVYVICIPVFPLLLLGYWLYTVGQDRAAKVGSMLEPKAYFASDAVRRGIGSELREAEHPEATIASDERVEELEELIVQGELDTALSRAEELLQTARAFKDPKGVAKFTKYARIIRARMKK